VRACVCWAGVMKSRLEKRDEKPICWGVASLLTRRPSWSCGVVVGARVCFRVAGSRVLYTKRNTPATVLKVHAEDPSGAYYTVQLDGAFSAVCLCVSVCVLACVRVV
jgi:hypothetical protein